MSDSDPPRLGDDSRLIPIGGFIVASLAATLSAVFLHYAVFITGELKKGSLEWRALAIIAALVAAGGATLIFRSSARAAERRNARRHQGDMFERTIKLYDNVFSGKGNANDTRTELPALVTQSLDLVKQLPRTDANHIRLVSESLESIKQSAQTNPDHVKVVSQSLEQQPKASDANYVRLVSEWLEWNKQLGKEADANHTRLVSEWLELMKEIASPVEGPSTGR